MENISPIEKIDIVLRYLKDNAFRHNFDSLLATMKDQKIVTNGPELRTLIDKLNYDRYVMLVQEQGSSDLWLITYEGLLFHGYGEQKRIDDINQSIAETDELVRKRNEVLLIRGTWFAGFSAAFLLLWQIFIYFYPIHKDYPLFFWQK